jgi:hypothetical protein
MTTPFATGGNSVNFQTADETSASEPPTAPTRADPAA